VNEPEKALDSLIGLEQFDEVPLTHYLRGVANAALGQMPAAIIDFQTVLAHRSEALMQGTNAYPMAEVGMARAYAANRDKTDSVAAYRDFLVSWEGADRGQPLIMEALAKSK
jgi:serine/threonine-protein kinase